MFPLAAPPDYATLSPLKGYEFDAFEFNDAWNASQWRIETKK